MGISKRIEDLHPDLAKVYAEAKASYIAAHPGGLRPQLSETARPAVVQTAYYAQGRQALAEVNKLRHIAGLNPIGAAENGRKITNAKAGQSAHNFEPSRAFDVVLVRADGNADWTEANYLHFAEYVKAAAAKLKVAVSQGAYWKSFKDYPHCELLSWRTMN
jgi:peptidoglycan L-alanyl-D-glutamate endopeptidase CwlK